MVGLIRILGAVIICISITDAKVEILTEETPYKPGIDLTLICKLEQFTETAHWMSNNDTIPIAYCLWTDCSLNPHYDEKYRFAFETDPEMFNLTIINLSLDDNGTELVCSDGSHSDSLRLIVSEDKHEDKTQDKKIQDKKIKDKKIQDTKIQVKKKVLKRNSAAKSTVPTVPVVAAAAAVVVAAVAVIIYIFRNKLNVLTKTICHFKINCHIWNFLRGAKNSAGNRRNRTYDKKDVNTKEEVGFLNSNTETDISQDWKNAKVISELKTKLAGGGGQSENQNDTETDIGQDWKNAKVLSELKTKRGQKIEDRKASIENKDGTEDTDTDISQDRKNAKVISELKTKLAGGGGQTQNQNGN